MAERRGIHMDAVLETFVDGFGEISFKFGMVRIELASFSGPEPRVTQRLIMTVQAFLRMQEAQQELLNRLESSGVTRSGQPSSPKLVPVQEAVSAGAQTPDPPAQPPRRGPPRSPNFTIS
jgi:hypothetical protein